MEIKGTRPARHIVLPPAKEESRWKQLDLGRLYGLLRLAVTLALAAYLVWRVRNEVGTLRLRLTHPAWLGLALGGVILATVLSARLWHLLIPPASRLPFPRLLSHYFAGFFWNNFLPSGVGGDAVRALALRASSGSTDDAVNSVLMSRLAGLWGIVLLSCAATVFHTATIGWQGALPLLLLTGAALVVTVGGSAFLLGGGLSRWRSLLPARLATWHASLRQYYNQPALLVRALCWAVAIQLCAVIINTLTAKALDLPITPGQLLVTMPLINLAAIVPISVGGFGVREGSYLYCLGLVGATTGDALLLSLAVYTLLIVVAAAGAGVFALLSPPTSSTRRDDPTGGGASQ
jgi:uncharacterized membrane protein YbhN (UPF0104 family)